MKKEKNILIAFILNLTFSVFELLGGFFTGSVAIISDSVHDLGDAVSIGISYFLEKKSVKQPDEKYTYGYARYSLLGGVITTCVLLFGSAGVIVNAVIRIFNPAEINYDGMLIFAVVGAAVNLAAAFFTRDGESVNQRAVNLHMLEDVLGWIAVLIGAVVMKFTDFALIDPLMSIGISLFILINAVKNLKEISNIFLEKSPERISVDEIREHLCELEGVRDVHHVHVRSLDGNNVYATMHLEVEEYSSDIKLRAKKELHELGISHSTLELECTDEGCEERHCHVHSSENHGCHHHHHHHGHGH